VRLTDQLPATAGSTSCTPGERRAMRGVNQPATLTHLLPNHLFPGALSPTIFQGSTPSYASPSSQDSQGLPPSSPPSQYFGAELSTCSYSNGSVVRPPTFSSLTLPAVCSGDSDLPSAASSPWGSRESDVLWHLKKCWENSLFLSHRT